MADRFEAQTYWPTVVHYTPSACLPAYDYGVAKRTKTNTKSICAALSGRTLSPATTQFPSNASKTYGTYSVWALDMDILAAAFRGVLTLECLKRDILRLGDTLLLRLNGRYLGRVGLYSVRLPYGLVCQDDCRNQDFLCRSPYTTLKRCALRHTLRVDCLDDGISPPWLSSKWVDTLRGNPFYALQGAMS